MMTRRFLLAAAAVTATARAIPSVPALAAEVAPAAPPPLPAWVVGRPDCFDWQIVRASTADEALRDIALSNAFPADCTGCDERDCDYCGTLRNLDVLRVPHMDAIANPTPADWLRANCGHCCSRCGYETFPEEGGHAIGDEAVCEDCMSPEDWQIADPERYFEMVAEGEVA